MNSYKVHYEMIVNMGTASMVRTLRAMIEYGVEMKSTMAMGRPGYPPQHRSVVMLLKIRIGYVGDFTRAVRPEHFEYKSPTRFERGTLISIYKSPEEEATPRKHE
jgi:hypothetical protein